MNLLRSRSLGLVVGVLATSMAFGQNIRPTRVERNVRPVIENTLKRFPQIDDRYREIAERPENPHPPISIIPGADNGLRVGGILPVDRVNPGSYFPGINETGWTPPDPNIAVGQTHVVTVVNSSIAFFTKAGLKTFQQNLDGASGFFGSVGASDFVFDPKCYYDRVNKRFFVIALDVDFGGNIAKVDLAVSSGENPNGTWAKYRIEAKQTIGTNPFWMDYPSIGNSSDAIAICGNMFGFTSGWNGVQFLVMPKAPLLAGQPVNVSSLSDPSAGSAQLGRNLDKAQTRIFGTAITATNSARIYAINNPATSPTLTFTNVAIPDFTPIARNAASANGRELDSLDGRIFNVVVRGTKMYAAHNVSAGPGDGRLACRWYEWNLRTWPVSNVPVTVQAGNVTGAAGEDFHMNGVETNGAGDVSMIFTRSSSSIVADVMVVGRKKSDALGFMGTPKKVFGAQSAAYGGAGGTNRWGDYFDMAVDPTDDLTFWGIGMTANQNGGWMTWIQNWKISTSLYGTPFSATAVAPYQGNFREGTLASIQTGDNLRYGVSSVLLPNAGQVAGAEATFELGQAASFWSNLTIQLETNGVAGATGMVWIFNVQTGQWDHQTSWALGTADVAKELVINDASIAKYVSPTGRVRIVTRGIAPIRRGVSTPFVFGTDLITIFAKEA